MPIFIGTDNGLIEPMIGLRSKKLFIGTASEPSAGPAYSCECGRACNLATAWLIISRVASSSSTGADVASNSSIAVRNSLAISIRTRSVGECSCVRI